MDYPVFAGSSTLAIPAAVDLFAGSAEVVTNRAKVGTDPIAQYQIVGLTNAGLLVPYDENDTDTPWVGIAAFAAVAGGDLAYYTAGDFNVAKLAPANGGMTLAEFKTVFARTPVAVSTVL